MFRIAVIFVLLFALATGFVWLADNPGTVTIKWPWADALVEVSLMQAAIVTLIIALLVMIFWWVVSGIVNSPKTFGRWRTGRRRDKGYSALSQGLVAAGAGNAQLARKLTKESGKLLENEPLVALLDAQTAMLENDRPAARKQFETMLGNDQTRLLGLRGLYLEAEQEGQMEAAAHFAKEATNHSPGTPWATQAQLKVQTITGEWEEAQRTLDTALSSNVVDKAEYKRQKAVMLTAQAMEEEDASPDKAKAHALAAHKLAPDLVPAAVLAARVAARLNDNRKANKVLETTWKQQPHPEIADTYVALRSGDSAADRLKRAEKLVQKRDDDKEAQFVLAKAAIDAGDFKKARSAMEIALKGGPTEKACLIMADIEEAEHGDRGRVREWLSRAVSAAKDPIWVADGVATAEWAPCSPVTGKLDAFEWKTPVEQANAAPNTLDYSRFVNEPLEDLSDKNVIDLEEITPVAAAVATASTVDQADSSTSTDEIEDAITVEEPVSDSSAESTSSEPTEKTPVLTIVKTDVDTNSATPEDQKINEIEEADNSDNASTTAKDATDHVTEEPPASPFKVKNLDTDEDGVIDHRPDDPGIQGEAPKKEGWLF